MFKNGRQMAAQALHLNSMPVMGIQGWEGLLSGTGTLLPKFDCQG